MILSPDSIQCLLVGGGEGRDEGIREIGQGRKGLGVEGVGVGGGELRVGQTDGFHQHSAPSMLHLLVSRDSAACLLLSACLS